MVQSANEEDPLAFAAWLVLIRMRLSYYRIGCAIVRLPNRFNQRVMADGMYVHNTKQTRIDVYPNLIWRGLWSEEYNGYSALV